MNIIILLFIVFSSMYFYIIGVRLAWEISKINNNHLLWSIVYSVLSWFYIAWKANAIQKEEF
jgi:hypothetical protein